MKKVLALIMVLVLSATCLTACGTTEEKTDDSSSSDSSETIKVGFIGPLTGDTALYGESVANGAQLYFDKINEEGGIDGKQIEYIKIDSTGDPDTALSAYNRLIDLEGVCAIVGPVLTGETNVIAQAAAEDGVPCITASATGDTLTDYGDALFRTCFKDSFQGTKLADYAKEVMGVSKVAILYANDDAYSMGLHDAFVAEAKEIGLEITGEESYASASSSDYSSQLTNLALGEPEAIFFPYYYAQCYDAMSQAKDIGLDVPFMGGDGLSSLVGYATDNSIIEGTIYTNHFDEAAGDDTVKAFASLYKETYGIDPLGFSYLAYDAAMILVNAIETSGSTDWDTLRETIKTTDMDCMTGHYVFDEDNNPIKQAAMTIIKNGENTFDRMF